MHMPTLRRLFGGAIALIGLLHVIFGEAPTRLFPVWPEWLPGRPWWAHAAGAALLVCGARLLRAKADRAAAACIAVVVTVSVLALHLPRAITSGALGNAWLSVFKFSALAAGAALVATDLGSARVRPRLDRALEWGAAVTPWLMALFMVYSGYLHFRYTANVTRLLPPWMPWQMFWVQFAGAALVAGGVGLLVRPVARAAALATAAMLAGFFFLVHIPRTLADPLGSTGWLELGEVTAYVMIALLLAQRATQPRSA
jgi:uncharacterized membrane protein